MAYGRILVPLDGSQLAEYILPQVESMATTFDSEVTLVHVIEANPARQTPSQRNARADVAEYMHGISDRLKARQVRSDWHVSFGEPAGEIARQVAEDGVDLVMMSTHGQGADGHPMIGSIAMEVVSSVSTPVILVRPPREIDTR